MLEELKRKTFKNLSIMFQKWSEAGSTDIEKELQKKDAGLVLCKKDGMVELYVHAATAKEAFLFLMDVVQSQFVDYTYNALVNKFPEIEQKINEASAKAIQQMDATENEPNEDSEQEEENPLVSPVIPRNVN